MGRFSSFVIFAEMRTGSNLLEASLEALDGVSVFGELFNPHFVGGPNRDEGFGLSLDQREAKPAKMIRAMKDQTDGLPGFRLFHDHDPRAVDLVLKDPDCAKIILTRRTVDSYVSRKIAAATGQWRLGDAKDQRSAQVAFATDEFTKFSEPRKAFQTMLSDRLKKSGQVAFRITYDDLQDIDVINGVATFLGVKDRLKSLPSKMKKQNPGSVLDLVSNPNELESAMAEEARPDLSSSTWLEPDRGPQVPSFLVGAKSAVVFQPIPGGPVDEVTDWMNRLDNGAPVSEFSQKTLRAWLAAHPGRIVFSVLRHPVERAFSAFQTAIIDSEGARPNLSKRLASRYGLMVEDPSSDSDLSNGFKSFLKFLFSNLNAQTSIPVQPDWASQTAILEGFGKFIPADKLIREEYLPDALAQIAGQLGMDVPEPTKSIETRLASIYDEEIEAMTKKVYRRDYVTLGFGNLRSGRF